MYSREYLRLTLADLKDWRQVAVDPTRKETLDVCVRLIEREIKFIDIREGNTYHPERGHTYVQ